MQKITSRENKRLKNTKKVRDGRIKDFIFIEGLRLSIEAFRSELELSEIFFSESFLINRHFSKIQSKFDLSEIEKFSIPDKLFKSIADTKSSQGIILIAKKPQNNKSLIESRLKQNLDKSLVIVLHKINNPSNLGAILRTAEAAGVLGIIITESSAKVFSPKTLRSSMGASFRIPIWENANFNEILEWASNLELKTICADINSEKSYLEINWNENYLIVFGSEAHGLSEKERKKIDESMCIPMENNVESLNLAVSCGIILFEAKKKNI